MRTCAAIGAAPRTRHRFYGRGMFTDRGGPRAASWTPRFGVSPRRRSISVVPWLCPHSAKPRELDSSSSSCPQIWRKRRTRDAGPRPGDGGPSLRVVVEDELVWMRTQAHFGYFARALVRQIRLDHVGGEVLTLEEELVVRLERIEGLLERARGRRHS